jgi:hypothetical protein
MNASSFPDRDIRIILFVFYYFFRNEMINLSAAYIVLILSMTL